MPEKPLNQPMNDLYGIMSPDQKSFIGRFKMTIKIIPLDAF